MKTYEITIQCPECGEYDIRYVTANEMPKEKSEYEKIDCCEKCTSTTIIFAIIAEKMYM